MLCGEINLPQKTLGAQNVPSADFLAAAPFTSSAKSGSAVHSRDVSLDYLKVAVILLMVAHHSCLAYVAFAHSSLARRVAPIPVVDAVSWRLFDYAQHFNDVFFMSLMFFISGLFVWPSLRRSGIRAFTSARLLRLGGPFAVGVLLLMPLAYYASPQIVGSNADYFAYWRAFVVRYWPSGPLWFIWLLLFFDLLAAGFFSIWPRDITSVPFEWTKRNALVAAAAMFGVCAIVYLPGVMAFGGRSWSVFFLPPFYFQPSRFSLYLAWFAGGAWLGTGSLERGFFSRDGALARHWPWWVLACLIAYGALALFPEDFMAAGTVAAPQQGLIRPLLWVVSNVTTCFAFLAVFRGVVQTRRPWADLLSRSAYVIFLVHYVYVLWLQHALLGLDVSAAVKFLLVFVGAVLLSWLTAQVLLAVPWLRNVL